MRHPTIDGSFSLSDEELIRLVMKAYKRTALIPSRGVWGYNKIYASATGVMLKAFGELPYHASEDWRNGFDLGFEQGHDYENKMAMLIWGGSKEFIKGFVSGHVVALAIFAWADAPNVDSKPEK